MIEDQYLDIKQPVRVIKKNRKNFIKNNRLPNAHTLRNSAHPPKERSCGDTKTSRSGSGRTRRKYASTKGYSNLT